MSLTQHRLGSRRKVKTPDLRQALMDALSKTGRASSDYDLNKDVVLPTGRKLTPASVLKLAFCNVDKSRTHGARTPAGINLDGKWWL